jgi:hypothetical protein
MSLSFPWCEGLHGAIWLDTLEDSTEPQFIAVEGIADRLAVDR